MEGLIYRPLCLSLGAGLELIQLDGRVSQPYLRANESESYKSVPTRVRTTFSPSDQSIIYHKDLSHVQPATQST